jgi:hypothetical protein
VETFDDGRDFAAAVFFVEVRFELLLVGRRRFFRFCK